MYTDHLYSSAKLSNSFLMAMSCSVLLANISCTFLLLLDSGRVRNRFNTLIIGVNPGSIINYNYEREGVREGRMRGKGG